MGFNLWAVWGASSQISLHLTPIVSDQQSSNNKCSDNKPLESQKLSIISSLCQIERSNRSFYNIVAKEIASGTREKLDIDVRLYLQELEYTKWLNQPYLLIWAAFWLPLNRLWRAFWFKTNKGRWQCWVSVGKVFCCYLSCLQWKILRLSVKECRFIKPLSFGGESKKRSSGSKWLKDMEW